ncbi:protein MKS1-like [Triticum urartu]|nr:protein MKS1-like [Triticum urartu]
MVGGDRPVLSSVSRRLAPTIIFGKHTRLFLGCSGQQPPCPVGRGFLLLPLISWQRPSTARNQSTLVFFLPHSVGYSSSSSSRCERSMDASSSEDRQSPRSRQLQLQGPRPPRLSVSKDSHKVRKPPVVPLPYGARQQAPNHRHQRAQPQPQAQQPRAPVIIYDASPKVIHTQPGEFLALVQRLTGPGAPAQYSYSTEAAAEPSAVPPQFQPQESLFSPAARYAAIERSVRPQPPGPAPYAGSWLDLDGFAEVLGPGRPGILSPVPSALPAAASVGLFSPLPFDTGSLSWLNDLSPFLASAGARDAPPFASSPGGLLLATPTVPSPGMMMRFFSDFPDL